MSIVTPSITYYPDPTRGRPVFNGSIYVGEPDLDPEIPANQKQASLRLEDGTTIPVAQPILTGAGGVVTYNGSYAVVVVDGDYSVKVLNSQGSQVYYVPSNSGIFDASQVSLTVNGLARDSVQSYLSSIAPQANYAAVRALDSSQFEDGDYVYVQGFPDPWQWKTGTRTDNGWYLVPTDNPGRYLESTSVKKWLEIFGCVGDGSTDNTTSLIAALTAFGSERLYCGKGTFMFNELAANQITTDFIIEGIKGDTIFDTTDSSSEFTFDTTTSKVVVKGIKFQNFDRTLRYGGSGTIALVEGIDCEFTNCTDGFSFFCKVTQSNLENIIIDGLSENGILIGNNTRADEDSTTKMNLNGLVAKNITNAISGRDTHAISFYGREVNISNFHIDTVTNGGGTGAEGIYLKARYVNITNGTMIDAGRAEGMLTMKGSGRSGSDPTEGPSSFDHNVSNVHFVARSSYAYKNTVQAIERISQGGNLNLTNITVEGTRGIKIEGPRVNMSTVTLHNCVSPLAFFPVGTLGEESNNLPISASNVTIIQEEIGLSVAQAVIVDNQLSSVDIDGFDLDGIKAFVNFDNVTATNYSMYVFQGGNDFLDGSITNSRMRYRGSLPGSGSGDKAVSVASGTNVTGLVYNLNSHPSEMEFDSDFSRINSYTANSNRRGAWGSRVVATSLGPGTTSGYVRTNAPTRVIIHDRSRLLSTTDDFWDLSGITTTASEYKKVLLCLDFFGTPSVIEGDAATSQENSKMPERSGRVAVVGYVEIPNNYSGGAISSGAIHEMAGQF